MGSLHFTWWLPFVVLLALHSSNLVEGNFVKSMHLDWGAHHSSFSDTGDHATLTLDPNSGSGIQSKKSFLFGSIEMQIKLVPGSSAGTVTAYYLSPISGVHVFNLHNLLSSMGDKHDEIDFEFLGNISGQPYIIHTNIYIQGAGGREQQFYAWFDPKDDYHNYTIHWNPSHVVWYVDSIPIRVYRNYESEGIPYPNQQAMKVYSSLWNGDSWATRGGLEKIDWTKAPFVARLQHFRARACKYEGTLSISRCANLWNSPVYSQLSSDQQGLMTRVRRYYIIYDHCKDFQLYNGQMPGECSKPQY